MRSVSTRCDLFKLVRSTEDQSKVNLTKPDRQLRVVQPNGKRVAMLVQEFRFRRVLGDSELGGCLTEL
ncbi:hypothetical protein TYRP_016222 [Tyrophagus putrescentiae]|nr:hypothetical protein TYRP_016222 [Tyrophagus putrescentiae]